MIRTNFYTLVLMVCSIWPASAQSTERPFIWVTPGERFAILEKIEQQAWANTIYTDFINRLNRDIEDHQIDPEQFLQGLPFDWASGKPQEIPPFFATYHLVNGEQRNLDNATEEEWAPAESLIRYLQTGLDCGIAYYLTEDEKYAQCATDILYTFVKGVLQSEVSSWQGRGGWLFPYDGFREVRVIGYRVPLIYDFVASYIAKGGKPFDIGKKARTDFPIKEAQQVFRTYADITVNYGHTGSNHPILEAPSLVYNALAMDDEPERAALLSYFLTQNTEHQDALNVMAGIYKREGDIWPETSQYLNAAGSILTHLMLVVNRYDPSLHLGEKYPNVLFSLPALDDLVYPNGELIRWGDGKRHGTPPYSSYEEAYLLGKMDGIEKITKKFGSLLHKAFAEGKYTRSGMESVLWYPNEYDGGSDNFLLPRTDQVTHAGIFLQRNISPTGNPKDGLMCFVGGAPMVHGHASGMDMELYGKGEVLGVDNGRGRYQQEIHENYSRIFAAHNTVIVNGSSRSDSGWVNLGINPVQLITMEPMPRQEAVSPNYSFTHTSFVDDKGDQAEAHQERMMVLVRTSDTTGYYVDVFRSRSSLPQQYHDYLYHNIGDTLLLLNDDLHLNATPERYLAHANDPWVQNEQYRHPGWHYFQDVRTSQVYPKDVQARFQLESFPDKRIQMNLFIPGFEDREYTQVKAPATFEAPSAYEAQTTPTLLIRQKGEAWEKPFVVVYEPTEGDPDHYAIQSVERLEQEGVFVGLVIKSKSGAQVLTQHILVPPQGEVYQDEASGIAFKGTLAIISYRGAELQEIYMGEGETLRLKDLRIAAEAGKRAGVSIDFRGAQPTATSNQIIKITAQRKIPVEYVNQRL